MGLASALAAQGGAAAGSQPPAQQYGAPPAGQQGWLTGAGPAGQQPYGVPPQQQYGAAPYGTAAPQGQPYGSAPAAAPSSAGMASVVAAKLAKIVAVNQLGAFYPPDKLQAVTARVTRSVDFHALAARCVVSRGALKARATAWDDRLSIIYYS